jgi:hypothetical protein
LTWRTRSAYLQRRILQRRFNDMLTEVVACTLKAIVRHHRTLRVSCFTGLSQIARSRCRLI